LLQQEALGAFPGWAPAAMIGVGIAVVLLVLGLLAAGILGRRRVAVASQPALIAASPLTPPEASQPLPPAALSGAPAPAPAPAAAATSPQPGSTHAVAPDDFDRTLERYADLLLRVGVNLQPGQTLVIGAPSIGLIDIADFIRRLAGRAWDLGAG